MDNRPVWWITSATLWTRDTGENQGAVIRLQPPCGRGQPGSTNSRSRSAGLDRRRQLRPRFRTWTWSRTRALRTAAGNSRPVRRGGATRPSEAPPSHTWRGLGFCSARLCGRTVLGPFCPSKLGNSARRAVRHTPEWTHAYPGAASRTRPANVGIGSYSSYLRLTRKISSTSQLPSRFPVIVISRDSDWLTSRSMIQLLRMPPPAEEG